MYFTLGHFVTLGPLTSLNLNILTIWVSDPWVSIQITFWVSLLPTKEVLHTCNFTLGHFVTLGPLTSLNLNILTIWVSDPWVSIQITFWESLLPTKEVQHTCKIVTIFNRRFTLGHFVTLGPLTSSNLNISTIWVRDPWVSIQINFWGSLLPTKEVLHTCKIIYYFKSVNYFESSFSPGTTHNI